MSLRTFYATDPHFSQQSDRKPVLGTDEVVLTSDWTPMRKDEADEFLRIGQNLTFATGGNLMGKVAAFWEDLYKEYRDGKGI